MKRIISFLLILALLVCLVACGNDGESSSSESQAEQSSTETQSESMESESVTESETQGNTSSESAVESESQSQSTESVTESETNSQSSETTTESEIESETNSETESESTTESETESEIESESSTETESETESESESESEGESQNPTTVAEWVEANSNEINAFMNTNYLTTFAKKGTLIGFDTSKVQASHWIFEGENAVTGVKLYYEYKTADTNQIIYIISCDLSSDVAINDVLTSGLPVESSTLAKEYSFSFNPTIQGTRDELVNALFKAVGVNEVAGERYLKPLSQTAAIDGLGMAYGFTIVEVGENGIKEYTIYINVADNDAGYIAKLANSSEYKITDSKEVDISGASVEYVAQ